MNFRKYITIASFASMALIGISCNNLLDLKPQGQFTADDAPGGGLEGQVFSIYTLMRSYNITAGIPAFAVECMRSEDSEKGSTASDGADMAEMFDNFNYVNNNGSVKAYWSHNYTIIYQSNSVLADIKTQGTTDDLSNKLRGEALFFRAYCYFNLVRAFGDVPLVTFKITDASQANVAKSAASAIYQQIDADLTEAEKLLPQSWSSQYVGRLTWGAARALHARTYMMRNDWANMYAASTEVINSGLYNLNTPYDKIFTDAGENSSESVFELQCTSTASLPASLTIGSQFCQVQGVRGSGQWNLGWGWHMGTKELGDAFESGDPRKDATLLYFRHSTTEPITAANTNAPYGESPVSSANGAYFNKKAYTDPAKRALYTKEGFWVNIRIIRYADVVLMAAESANELGKSSEASNYLEMVRARARGTNATILPKVTSLVQNVLRDSIRHERRVELGLESGRFYDLVRWGIAADVLHAVGKVNYQAKHALLPIPQDEIDKSKGVLVQNPNF
ncbi:MAG: RagB/SusD family nutrient uptake outer membrane protein [Bacteroidota bacterium]|nr:RagB/SusD family nutrient uptake outer membrane protein [Bacteroidota bacterium]MDP4269258.1 RagB/SusD family nutrient uptake outer membrane protein [Bacteroidota bacterium]